MTSLEIQCDVPLAPLTTLELGGPAAFFASVRSEAELRDSLRWAREEGLPTAVLGGGSNLIVPDHGYRGLVIHMAIDDLELLGDGSLHAGAGVPWERVVDRSVAAGWAGVECLTGIPGSTGATPIQNVGAYGQEVSETIDRVRAVDRARLEPLEMLATECDFSYRDSCFKREPDRFVVTAVHFKLRPGGAPSVRYAELEEEVHPGASLEQVRAAVLELRRRKSMVIDLDDPNHRSVGSFFVNPIVPSSVAERIVEQSVREGLVARAEAVPCYPVGEGRTKLAAGWLIEHAGIAKGTRRGAVGVSTRHALALVHHGGGTTSELLALAQEIDDRVRDRFGVELEREPRLLE